MEKIKIVEEVRRLECEIREKARFPTKRDAIQAQRPNKRAREDRPRPNVIIVVDGRRALHCATCGKRHPRECWRSLGACLGYGSLEHKINDCLHQNEHMQAPEQNRT